ncbi:unnamed protein product [Chironomus riparius]|uniref:CLIP domain-containing serine protease n=1 Tax=Chironomus riparius TaxID=315576 RepID=A0A9P0J4N2_9DIPT|nr:unnamed protein product [Chironomus riparius]
MLKIMKLNACLVLLTICQIIHTVNSKFATCTSNESCIPFPMCDAVNKIRDKQRLSAEDDKYLKSIHCKTENRLAYACCANKVKVNFESKLPKSPKCGIQFSNRIIGGEIANIDEYPWTVQIQHINENNSTESFCGGTLINESYVLTAAHCTKLKPFQVRLGDWDIGTNPDCDEDGRCNDPYVEIPIENITVHENYNFSIEIQCNDIALIKLQRNVTLSDFIKPICLPIDEHVQNMNLTDHYVEVAGFGCTNVENQTMSVRKKWVGLRISPQSYCKKVYARRNVVINSKQVGLMFFENFLFKVLFE